MQGIANKRVEGILDTPDPSSCHTSPAALPALILITQWNWPECGLPLILTPPYICSTCILTSCMPVMADTVCLPQLQRGKLNSDQRGEVRVVTAASWS